MGRNEVQFKGNRIRYGFFDPESVKWRWRSFGQRFNRATFCHDRRAAPFLQKLELRGRRQETETL
jgi:hypothetical protein